MLNNHSLFIVIFISSYHDVAIEQLYTCDNWKMFVQTVKKYTYGSCVLKIEDAVTIHHFYTKLFSGSFFMEHLVVHSPVSSVSRAFT